MTHFLTVSLRPAQGRQADDQVTARITIGDREDVDPVQKIGPGCQAFNAGNDGLPEFRRHGANAVNVVKSEVRPIPKPISCPFVSVCALSRCVILVHFLNLCVLCVFVVFLVVCSFFTTKVTKVSQGSQRIPLI